MTKIRQSHDVTTSVSRNLDSIAPNWLTTSDTAGVKIGYGIPEDWKHAKSKDGLSKRARTGRRGHPRKDGRPPDTSKDLVGRARKGRGEKSAEEPPKSPGNQLLPRRPSYCWHKNSCYLDTSLELIFQTVSRNFHREFGARGSSLHHAELIAKVFEHMTLRRTVEDDPSGGVSPTVLQVLSTQRRGFRKFLKENKIVPDPYAYNPLFVISLLRFYAPLTIQK